MAERWGRWPGSGRVPGPTAAAGTPLASWLATGLPAGTATTVASAFWIVSLIGFVAAALAFWGIGLPGRGLAPAGGRLGAHLDWSASSLFFGTWPMFNTLAALTVNVAVLVALLGLRWPPEAMFGR